MHNSRQIVALGPSLAPNSFNCVQRLPEASLKLANMFDVFVEFGPDRPQLTSRCPQLAKAWPTSTNIRQSCPMLAEFGHVWITLRHGGGGLRNCAKSRESRLPRQVCVDLSSNCGSSGIAGGNCRERMASIFPECVRQPDCFCHLRPLEGRSHHKECGNAGFLGTGIVMTASFERPMPVEGI